MNKREGTTAPSIDKKQERLGRAGVALTGAMLVLGAAASFASSASAWIAAGLGFGGLVLFWLALSAKPRVAIALGRWFPLG